MTMSGMIVGTPDYMSPEQAQGKEVDARSDIFSAAGVFYFMLTGRRPFEAPGLPGVLHKVVREDPLPIREHEAPSALAEMIAKGVHKDPGSRYQRCGDMAADIVRFKRQFDKDTRKLIASARERFDRVNELVSADRNLRGVLEMPPSDALATVVHTVHERYPFFASGDRDFAGSVQLHRSRVTAILEDLDNVLTSLTSGVDALRGSLVCVEAGEVARRNGDSQAALRYLDRAFTLLPDPSARVAACLASARQAVGDTILLEPRREQMPGSAEEAEEISAQREYEAAQVLEDARKQLAARNYDRAAWLAENALLLCPGYPPAQQVLVEARTSLAGGAFADPDDTVQFSNQNSMNADPAATVVITPIGTRRVPASTETWTSKLRRRLHMVPKDTASRPSHKARSIGSR